MRASFEESEVAAAGMRAIDRAALQGVARAVRRVGSAAAEEAASVLAELRGESAAREALQGAVGEMSDQIEGQIGALQVHRRLRTHARTHTPAVHHQPELDSVGPT